MATHNVRRKLVAILAADAVGYSRLMGANEEQTMRVLNAHRAVIDGIIEYHEGRIVGTAGDSVLAEFGSPTDAVRCAVEIQDALKTRNNSLPEIDRLHFRIGINLGDVMIKGDDLLGDGVNIAARLESIAEPGGICISSSVYDQIAGKLDLGFVEMGEQQLKNIERPIRVYRVGTGVARPALASSAPTRKPPGRWLYAAGVAAIVLAAVAVVPRLRESPPMPPTVPPVPAPPAVTTPAPAAEGDAQRTLEAQRNAEEKARLEVAAAKALADAEVAKARAEAELARRQAAAEGETRRALEAQRNAEEKARVEIAAAKARADAELAKARAEAEAAKPRAEAAVARAKPQAPPAPPAPVLATTVQPEVAWVADRSCEPFQELKAFKDQPSVAVSDGEFTVERGQPGWPGYMLIRGKSGADGALMLNGYGIGLSAEVRGEKLKVGYEGRLEGDRYLLKGRHGSRACTLTISQAAADVATARARQSDMPASPVFPPSAPAKTELQGVWIADRSCEASGDLGAFKDRAGVTVANGEFVVERGQRDQPGNMVVRGKPAADGTLRLDGYGIGAAGTIRGKQGPVTFAGRLEGDRYLLKGRLGMRACTLTISRR